MNINKRTLIIVLVVLIIIFILLFLLNKKKEHFSDNSFNNNEIKYDDKLVRSDKHSYDLLYLMDQKEVMELKDDVVAFTSNHFNINKKNTNPQVAFDIINHNDKNWHAHTKAEDADAYNKLTLIKKNAVAFINVVSKPDNEDFITDLRYEIFNRDNYYNNYLDSITNSNLLDNFIRMKME